jgi:hypothetical protein
MFYGNTHILCVVTALMIIVSTVGAASAASMSQAELAVAIEALEPNPQGPQGSPPPCQLPPEDAPKEVKDCFDSACNAYLAAYAACNGNPICEISVQFQYALALGHCGTERWATIWYYEGTYGVAFEEREVPSGVTRFDF